MLSVQSTIALALMLFVLVEYSAAMPTIDKDKARYLNNVNVSKKIKSRDSSKRLVWAGRTWSIYAKYFCNLAFKKQSFFRIIFDVRWIKQTPKLWIYEMINPRTNPLRISRDCLWIYLYFPVQTLTARFLFSS